MKRSHLTTHASLMLLHVTGFQFRTGLTQKLKEELEIFLHKIKHYILSVFHRIMTIHYEMSGYQQIRVTFLLNKRYKSSTSMMNRGNDLLVNQYCNELNKIHAEE